MTTELSFERVDELPGNSSQRTDPPQLWSDMVEALREGYTGWLKVTVPSLKAAHSLYAALRYYTKRSGEAIKLESHRRIRTDRQYDIYSRLVQKEKEEEA